MALPKEKAGSMTKPSTRITMTLAAMNCSPKLLVSDCTTIMDMEKIAWVTPDGRPSRMSRPIFAGSGRRCSLRSSKISFIFVSLRRHRMAEINWAMMVARATPGTPRPRWATKI